MGIRINCAICCYTCMAVRSQCIIVSQNGSQNCTMMWIRSLVSVMWKECVLQCKSKSTPWGQSSAHRPRIKLQWSLKDYKVLHFSYYGSSVWILVCVTSWFCDLLSLFINPWISMAVVHSKPSFFYLGPSRLHNICYSL